MNSTVLDEVLIKAEAETNPQYGHKPSDRPLEEHIKKGIVNLDKPAGPTSQQVTSWVKNILKVKKAGHSGTLDPKVTGVFPIGIEDSTKIIHTVLPSRKEYVAFLRLHSEVKESKLQETLDYFQGELFQRPPLKSSVKRKLRKRTIYEIELIESEGQNILIRINCEAGTYIRKLCHDIGLVLGTGAHMQELRRTKAGPFDESSIVKLHDLKDTYEFYNENGDEKQLRNYIHPIESGVMHLRKIWLKDSAVSAICHGAMLNAPGVARLSNGIQKDDFVALMTLKDELVALARSHKKSDEIMEMNHGVVASLEAVIMAPNIYPKKWGKD